MKKIFSIILAIIILLNNVTVYADELDWEKEPLYQEIQEELVQTSNETNNEPKINSRAVIVLDRESKKILYEKNSNVKKAMASTTKIMTGIILIEYGNLNKQVEISSKAAMTGGSRLGLKKGDKITLNDLLYGLMLCSGNDAAVAIAEEIGGTVECFAELMNKKAELLGLKDTNFVTPHGLDNENHYTTAYELALLTDYAMKIEKFAQVVKTKNYTVTINGYSKNLNNTNELLGVLQGVNGVKTGFTNNAGRCLVTSTIRDNFNIITVVLGADTKKIRTKDSIRLIEYVYENFEIVDIEQIATNKFENWESENLKNIQINKGIYDNILLELEEFPYKNYPILKEDIKDISIEIDFDNCLEAPIEKNKVLGTLNIYEKEEKVLEINIKNKEYISKKNMLDYMFEITENYNNIIKEYFEQRI